MQCPSCGAQVLVEELDCTQCGASVGWWVRTRRGEESGPYTLLHMQEMIRQGQVGPLDRVRIGLIGEWVSAPEVLSPTFQHPEPAAQSVAAPRRLRRSRGPRTGLLIGAGAALLAVAAAVVVVVGTRVAPRNGAPEELCRRNLSSLARALRLYAEDQGGWLPTWQAWGAAAFGQADDPGAFVCPAAPSEPGYGYNAALGGVSLGAVRAPARCVMLWDAGALGPLPGLSLNGQAPRHRTGDNWAFTDGHVAWLARGPYSQMDLELQP